MAKSHRQLGLLCNILHLPGSSKAQGEKDSLFPSSWRNRVQYIGPNLALFAAWPQSYDVGEFCSSLPSDYRMKILTRYTRLFVARRAFPTLALLLCTTFAVAQGVGIHVNLRSNANPRPGTDVYADVVAEGNYAYVGSWHNTTGVWIFDISNPDAATYVSRFAPPGSKNMQGIEVLNGIGYFGDDNGNGIFIVDLSNPLVPKLITRVTSAQGGYDYVHNLTLDGNGHMFVPHYRVNDDVQVWNISDPAHPVLQMTLTGTDTSSVHDVTVKNNRLFMNGWGGQVDIWDITNLDAQSPVRLGSFFSGLHTQATAVTDDGNFLACPRELASNGDVGIFNISDPANVFKVADITEPGWGIAATSPATSKIMGDYLYVAWFQAGLLVFDISDPTNPIMVGSYDTWPGYSYGGSGGGDGDWGVWPFLGADRVLISDRTTGLYVLDTTGISSEPAVYSLLFNPSTVLGSTSTEGTVYLLGVSPCAGETVSLSSNNPAINPNPVFVPTGTHSASFSQSTSSVATKTVVSVTTSDGVYSASSTVTLTSPIPSAVGASPASVVGGLATTGRVSLNAPAAVNTTVALNIVSGASAVASMPSAVVVPAGSSSTTWPINTNQLTATTRVTISASANGATKKGSLTVKAITLSGIRFAPTSVSGGNSTTGTLSFSQTLAQDTIISLAAVSGGTAVASTPSSVTASAGSSSVSFNVLTNPVMSSTTVKISASANGGTKTGSFKVY